MREETRATVEHSTTQSEASEGSNDIFFQPQHHYDATLMSTSVSRISLGQCARRERERAQLARVAMIPTQSTDNQIVDTVNSPCNSTRSVRRRPREMEVSCPLLDHVPSFPSTNISGSELLYRCGATSTQISGSRITVASLNLDIRPDQCETQMPHHDDVTPNRNSVSTVTVPSPRSRRSIAQRARRQREVHNRRQQFSLQIQQLCTSPTQRRPDFNILPPSAVDQQPDPNSQPRHLEMDAQNKGKSIIVDSSPTIQQRMVAYLIGSSSTSNSDREHLVHHYEFVPVNASDSTPTMISPPANSELPEILSTQSHNTDVFDDNSYDDTELGVQEMQHRTEPIINLPVGRHFLGRMDVICQSCSSLHWRAEQLRVSSRTTPLFGMCCFQGKIRLTPLQPLPPALHALYEGSDVLSQSFRRNIRSYNASNAFTSLGVGMDNRMTLQPV